MKERMNIVIVGHVDHGKSTLVGRLLADTNSLPQGKLEQVKKTCEINSKPFEYAFLLDALIDEQAQGITIDTARIFFKSPKREYIIIDAPGHIEFLKNMISGAARAEAAILLIDAHEGIAENSVNMITKSGTNKLHGSLSYSHGNDSLDARQFFHLPDFQTHRIHSGAVSLGGPILKDHVLFFVNYGMDRAARAPIFSMSQFF